MPRKKSAAKRAREEQEAQERAAATGAPAAATAKPVTADDEPAKKKTFLDFSDDDEDDKAEEVTLGISEAYAARFKHNKEREELMRLQEKLKGGELDESDSDESSSEDEDEYAELVTEDVDAQISKVLQAIRNKDQSLLDPATKFFEDEAEAGPGDKKERPMYLKDYHRMKLLADADAESDDESSGPLPPARQLELDRQKLVEEINAAASDDEAVSDDDAFTQVKEQRQIEAIELPDPDVDPTGFVEKYLTTRAWIPDNKRQVRVAKGPSKTPAADGVDELHPPLQDEESDFEDRAEEFETKYNFRFEAGQEATEVVSYARDVDGTVRRKDETTRQRERRRKQEEKEARRKEREQDLQRLKKLKVKEVIGRLERIRRVAGLSEAEVAKFDEADLEADYDDSAWDRKMHEVFNDDFYHGDKTKPVWDDDIDIADIVPDYESDDEPKKKSKKDRRKEQQDKKKTVKELHQKVEDFVDQNIMLDEAAVKEPETRFRYREVSPDSYGLDPADILMADDNDLNEYVGLKKLAPYRDDDKKAKDRKKFAKKKRLREWRKQVFGSAEGPVIPEEAPAAKTKGKK
ncbi:KRI1-like family C-terminal-domain-containing protein [Dipodascopsis tothii]|uniref:KRI1-like family C-terminal-domain-containing protein n=1 Tax=Dipodascopsis tothii TaxID=44089 RepID=UPI0034CEB661